jgi:hypothetical protein
VEACGEVWSGSEWVPVACSEASIGGHPAHSASVVIPYELMKPRVEELPKIVDHRAEGTEGPIRKQGGSHCTAFAFTSALDHAYARWTGTAATFSVMEVFARYHQHQEIQAIHGNLGDTIGNESDWPYDYPLARTWQTCHPDPKDPSKSPKPGIDCGVAPDEAKLASLQQGAVAIITKVELIPATAFDIFREKIAAGNDLVVSLKLPTFATAGQPGEKYIVGVHPNDPKKVAQGSHETLLVGYAMTPNGNYYLIHNSWGPKWGDDGYAWLHEDFLKAFWSDKYVAIPDVEPLQVAKVREDAMGRLTSTCPTDQVPDSISGLCAGRCPDGSPRHNDVCANATDCPRGEVNLTGECLLAAPPGQGRDPMSGVAWACGLGGCTYAVPQGQLCTGPSCTLSCPAPDFRLATTPRGLGCVD